MSETANRQPTVAHILAWRAEVQGHLPAFSFMDRKLRIVDTDSYATLAEAARRVSRVLDALTEEREPVIVACEAGLSFVRALFGVLWSGRAAAPTQPPDSQANVDRLNIIAHAVNARYVIASRAAIERMDSVGSLNWIAIEDCLDSEPVDYAPEVTPKDAAVFQFSSGTVGDPHGVCISHQNLMENNEQIRRAFVHTSKHRGLIWLPPHHDMGLVGGILQPVYAGFRTTLMAPRTFLADPLNWLKAISMTGASTSGGPNFAYERCLDVHDADIENAHLDLHTWQVAFNGAETVEVHTMKRFAERFLRFGFRKNRFIPCYGLAEATLMVCAAPKLKKPIEIHVDRSALYNGKVVLASEGGPGKRTLTGHGHPGSRVQIAGAGGKKQSQFKVGEIYVTGPSLATPVDVDDYRFNARLEDHDENFVRTGDLGFIVRGELFITGRSSSVIIVRGKNHQAEDIESTARVRPELAALGSAVVQLDGRVILVQEVPKALEDGPVLLDEIRSQIAARHGLALSSVTLVRRHSLTRTPSGKVRRSAVADDFEQGTLRVVLDWQAPARTAAQRSARLASPPAIRGLDTEEAIEQVKNWLGEMLAAELQVPPDTLDPDTHFGVYGLDSVVAASLSAHLTDTWGETPNTVFWDYPNFSLLASYLVNSHVPATLAVREN